MIIHVVEPGETIESIASKYNMSIQRLLDDNGLKIQDGLVVGQSIVIAIPELTYTVQDGDSLSEIALKYKVTIMDLLRNNPWLLEREYIFPGDVLVISYSRTGKIATHGNTFPYVSVNTLKKTLPYLTYLSIINYTATEDGEIITHYDDSEVIELAKAYDVLPLMLVTTLSLRGEANVRTEFELLLNEEIQDKQIENVINILKEKGYFGVNVSFQYVDYNNIPMYERFYSKYVTRLYEEGFYAFATINPNITFTNGEINFERIYYTIVNQWEKQVEHIVWFIDARTISAWLDLVKEHELLGTAIWNIMIYNPQFWLMINSQFEIEKFSP